VPFEPQACYVMAMTGERVGSRALYRLQDRLLHLLGNDVDRRPKVVQAMLHRDANESVKEFVVRIVSGACPASGVETAPASDGTTPDQAGSARKP